MKTQVLLLWLLISTWVSPVYAIQLEVVRVPGKHALSRSELVYRVGECRNAWNYQLDRKLRFSRRVKIARVGWKLKLENLEEYYDRVLFKMRRWNLTNYNKLYLVVFPPLHHEDRWYGAGNASVGMLRSKPFDMPPMALLFIMDENADGVATTWKMETVTCHELGHLVGMKHAESGYMLSYIKDEFNRYFAPKSILESTRHFGKMKPKNWIRTNIALR